MKRRVIVILSACALFTAASGAQLAGAANIGVTATDMKKVEAGWSAKKDLIGRVVYNEHNERVGKIEDLMLSADQPAGYAIVSTGDFVGGKHDVAIPLNQFRSEHGKFVLPGATKDQLKALPAYVAK